VRPPKVVQERLGHRSITVTLDTYSHVIPTLQESAAEMIGSVINPSLDGPVVSDDLGDGSRSSSVDFRDTEDRSTGFSPS
jgi:hypothetical protein